MKKSLLALAVLGAFAGAASAQSIASAPSSVTLSGMVDAGVRSINGDIGLAGSQSAYNNFAISVREDLGGGMTAFGYLQHRFNIQNGSNNTGANGVAGGAFWRNSFVGLAGGWGDVRLGRMLMPLQDFNGGYDVFATGYTGTTHTGGITATVRANNTVYYRSPTMGGFSFHAAIAAGEGQYIEDITDAGRKYFSRVADLNRERPQGIGVKWASGPFSIAAAYDINATDLKTYGLYGSWDFGAFKLFGQYENGEAFTTPTAAGLHEDIDTFSISASMPLGAFVLKAGYANISSDLNNRDGYKFGLGAEYFLSKRTSLYTNMGKLNGDRFNGVFASGDEKDIRWDIGITHRF